jgi:hypothetical protein
VKAIPDVTTGDRNANSGCAGTGNLSRCKVIYVK